MENTVKKREWVKTAAIIFLAVMLVLTFFSKTILNASLPEVATSSVTRGSINARLRGQGTVSANETYEVTISQTRKIESVKCRVGDTVKAGDVLFILEATESDEVKQAQEQLESMQLNYSKTLISAGNDSARENRHMQELRDAYNEALALYNRYSSMDPAQLAIAQANGNDRLKELQRDLEDLNDALAEAQGEDYTKAQADVEELKAQVDAKKEEVDSLSPGSGSTISIEELEKQIKELENALQYGTYENEPDYVALKTEYDRAIAKFRELDDRYSGMDKDQIELEIRQYYDLLMINICHNDENLAKLYASDLDQLVTLSYQVGIITQMTALPDAYITAQKMACAYESTEAVNALNAYVDALRAKLAELKEELANYNADVSAQNAYERAVRELNELKNRLANAQFALDRMEDRIDSLKDQIKSTSRAIKDQQEINEKLSSASGAAESVKATRKALEDALFEQGLGDTEALDMQKAKEDIEKQEALIESLKKDADAQEVTAKVGGIIGEINVNAGNSIGADSPLAVINLVDRGYTVQIPVSVDDAKKVRIGDTADLLNYWGGNVSVVLEKIVADSSNPSRSRLLVFRVDGDIEPGTNVTISIGQKSANYDALVPLAALHEDTNGKFVLVITSKSTPLGNRYTALRADVQELGRDDTYAAVSGVTAGDFVITTSTQPISNGMQVRLADNG